MKRQILLCALFGFLFSQILQAKISSTNNSIVQKPTVKNVLENGMAQDGTDQSDELKILLADNVHLFFPKGVYHFTETVETSSLENFTLEGEIGTEIITNKPILFEIGGTLKNVLFKKISIRSTDTTPSSGGQLSLIHSNENNILNLTFEDVLMTAPKSATNGFKFINERNTRTKGVVLRRFKVDSIGRMGFEIQSHHRLKPEKEIPRYENIVVEDSEFNHTGLREYGMGVSVGGFGKNVRIVNSNFTDSPNRAVEIIGVDGVHIEGNCFEDNFASIIITRNELNTEQITKNVIIANNVADGSEGESFIDIENLSMNNNTFRIEGRMKFENITGARIKSLTIDTDAYAALVVGGLKNFEVIDSSIKNKRAGNNLIRIEDESSGFSILKTDFYTGEGQKPFDNIDGTISVPEFSEVNVYNSLGELVKTLNSK